MINRLVSLLFLLLLFCSPACGGQTQPDYPMKGPLVDFTTGEELQKKQATMTTVAIPPPVKSPSEENSEEESSVFDDEHG